MPHKIVHCDRCGLTNLCVWEGDLKYSITCACGAILVIPVTVKV